MVKVKMIGAITKAIKNRIPGAKNLIGIENLVRYVKLRMSMPKAKKAPIAYSPEAKALWVRRLKIAVTAARMIILRAKANFPLKI
jgi:hypothetical protein